MALILKLPLWKKKNLNLNIKKSSTSGSIPATILKQFSCIYLPFLTKSVNYTIIEGELPLFKKEEPLKKEN